MRFIKWCLSYLVVRETRKINEGFASCNIYKTWKIRILKKKLNFFGIQHHSSISQNVSRFETHVSEWGIICREIHLKGAHFMYIFLRPNNLLRIHLNSTNSLHFPRFFTFWRAIKYFWLFTKEPLTITILNHKFLAYSPCVMIVFGTSGTNVINLQKFLQQFKLGASKNKQQNSTTYRIGGCCGPKKEPKILDKKICNHH